MTPAEVALAQSFVGTSEVELMAWEVLGSIRTSPNQIEHPGERAACQISDEPDGSFSGLAVGGIDGWSLSFELKWSIISQVSMRTL